MNMKQKDKKNALKWIITALNRKLSGVIELTISNALLSGSVIFLVLILKRIIDMAVIGDKKKFFLYAICYGIIVIMQIMLRAVIRYLNEKTRAVTENTLKAATYTKLLNADYAELSRYHSGEYINRMTNDIKIIAENVTEILPGVVSMCVKIIGAMAVLLCLDSKFALIFIGGGILLVIFSTVFRKRLKKLHKAVQEKEGKVTSFLLETMENLIVIRSFQAEDRAVLIAEERMDEHMKARMKKNTFSNICNIGFGSVMNGGYYFGLVWCGFKIMHGDISYGTLTAILQLIYQLQQPFANVTGYIPKYYSMCASIERIMEFDSIFENEIYLSDELSDKQKEIRAKVMNSNRDIVCTEIKIDNITFYYPNRTDEYVLKDASFTINKGDCIAITGRSGIGKSTLLKLLLSIYKPNSGDIKVGLEDMEGRTVSVPLDRYLRKLFSYVPQGNALLSGSIYEAVAFLTTDNDNISESEKEKIKYACKVACADVFVNELEKGYDTVIGERGMGLSEGQVQRLAIARAVYYDAPIVLLDEATSALDEITEKKVLFNLQEITDKTILIVTHRKAAFSICSRVIDIENGGFVEKNKT